MRKLTIEEKDLLARVEANSDLESFFFKKLKGLQWLLPLYGKGFFSVEKIPVPVPAKQEGYMNIPYWPASIYLANVSIGLGAPENLESSKLVIKIIRECTQYAKEHEINNYKVWYQFAQALPNLPLSLINDLDISAIEYWLSDPYEQGITTQEIGIKLLEKLVNDENKHEYALSLLKTLFSVTYDKKETGSYERVEANFQLREYSLEKIVTEVAPTIGKKLKIEGLKLFELLLSALLEETKKDAWSNIWRNAIEDNPKNGYRHGAGDILIRMFRDALLGYVDEENEQSELYLKDILSSEYQVLKRVAIYVIGERYQLLHNLAPDVVSELFFDDDYRHEIWHFMNKNFDQLPQNSRDSFLEFIGGIVINNEDNSLDERATAYRKTIWLSSIKGHSGELSNQYNELVKLAGTEPEHPDFTSYTSVGWVGDKSPIPLGDLQKMEIDELIETMDNTEEGNGFREPGRSGLIKAFRSVVKNDPKHILSNIDLFVDKDLAYSHQILEGFKELWKDNASLSWDDAWKLLLGFCSSLINRDDFWSEENSRERDGFIANRHWIISSVSELIEQGVRADEHAFDIELNPLALEIITALLDNQGGGDFDISHDAVSTAINTPRGRCIEALINLALRSMRACELADETKDQVWDRYVCIFDAELKKAERNEFEFVTLVTNYLPNFLYMSKEWTLGNLPLIFNRENYQAWVSAFSGYSYVGDIYQNVYEFLRDNNHFSDALDDENLKSQVSDKIIQGAVVAYINDFDGLDDDNGILSLIIDRNKYEELHQVIWFSWTQRRKENASLTSKILELWPRILETVDFESRDGRKIASDLCDWIVFVEEITEETYNWLYQIAPYAEENHNSHEFIKGICKISENEPHKAQKLWIRMLDQFVYAYPEEEIKGILRNFLRIDLDNSAHEGRRLANEVIDAYIKQDQDKPRDWLNQLLDSDS